MQDPHAIASPPSDQFAGAGITRHPYHPDRIRAHLAYSMAGFLGLTIIGLFFAATCGEWERVREFSEIVLPLEAAMVGTALTFYYVTKNE